MKGRAAVTCCPKYAAPALPNPPALTKEPVVVDVLAVVSGMLTAVLEKVAA
jgi:hypothetical protein